MDRQWSAQRCAQQPKGEHRERFGGYGHGVELPRLFGL